MDVKEYPSLLARKTSDKETKNLKESIRAEINATCKRGGCYVDRVISFKDLSLPLNNIDGLGHTLLHLSVYYELVDSIEELLSVGARTDICDKFGITAYELALDTGNQEVVFKMARRESYQNYLHFIEKYNSILEIKFDDSDDAQVTVHQEQIKGKNSLRRKVDFYNQSKMLEWDENIEKCRYDDYLLWTDSTRSVHLTKLLGILEERERTLNATSRELIKRKVTTALMMQAMHEELREKEHHYSLQIFDNIKLWRSFRRKLLRLTDKVNHIKTVLEEARKKCFWRRDVNFRHYSGLVLKFWTACEMTLSGENVTLREITEESCVKSSLANDEDGPVRTDKNSISHQVACGSDEKLHILRSNSEDRSWHGSSGNGDDRFGGRDRARRATSVISEEQFSASKGQEGDSERTSSVCDDPEVASIVLENKRSKGERKLMHRNKKAIERVIPLENIREVAFRMSSHKKCKESGSKMMPQVAEITITYFEGKDSRSGNSESCSTAEISANRKSSIDGRMGSLDLKSTHRVKESKAVIQIRNDSFPMVKRSSLTQRDRLNSTTSIDAMDLMEQIQDFVHKLRNLTKEGQISISYSDSSIKKKAFVDSSFSSVAANDTASQSQEIDPALYSSGMDDTDHDQSDGKNMVSDGDDNGSHSRSYNSSTGASELRSQIRAIDSFVEEKRPVDTSMFCTHRSQSYCSGRTSQRSARRQHRLRPKRPTGPSTSSSASMDSTVSYSSPRSALDCGKCPVKASSGDESIIHAQRSVGDGRSSVSGLTSIESGDLSASSSNMQDIDRLFMKLLHSASASGALSCLDPSLIDIAALSQSYSAELSCLNPSSLRLYLEGGKTISDASQSHGIESIKRILMELTASAKDDDGILETILLSIERSKAEGGSNSTRSTQASEKNISKLTSSQSQYKDDNSSNIFSSESKRAPLRRSDDKKSMLNLISKRSKTSCEIISMLETKVSKYRTERNFYWTRLEEVINTREHLLECLRYLRSLRSVVSNPPPSPTSTLSSTLTSMEEVLEKVASFQDKCESPYLVNRRNRDSRWTQQRLSDSASANQVVGIHSTTPMDDIMEIRGRLSLDRSEEIRLSLLAPNPVITTTWSQSPGGVSSPFANPFLSPSTLSTVRPSPWKVSVETQQHQQSLIQRKLLQNSVQQSVEKLKKSDSLPSSPANIKKVLFSENVLQSNSPECTISAVDTDGNKPTETSKRDQNSDCDRKKDSSTRSYPLNLGVPPEGCEEDLQNVVGLLRDLWDCELRSFETVGRLTELFVSREETLKKLTELAEKEKKPPTQSELFDIQL